MGKPAPTIPQQKQPTAQKPAAPPAKPQAQAKPKPKRNSDTGRLPDGTEFAAKYDGAAKVWRGKLTIGGTAFDGDASGIFKLLISLDTAYRASIVPAAGAAAAAEHQAALPT
jgi:hypothetical protein